MTFAVLMTAPTPVMTLQPTRQALSNGMSLRTGTAPDWGTTAYSAKQAVRAKWWILRAALVQADVPSNITQRAAVGAVAEDGPAVRRSTCTSRSWAGS